jgi:hypothetical protein
VDEVHHTQSARGAASARNAARRGVYAQHNAPAEAAGAPACAEATQRRSARGRGGAARGAARAERVAAMVPLWVAQALERREAVHATSAGASGVARGRVSFDAASSRPF